MSKNEEGAQAREKILQSIRQSDDNGSAVLREFWQAIAEDLLKEGVSPKETADSLTLTAAVISSLVFGEAEASRVFRSTADNLALLGPVSGERN